MKSFGGSVPLSKHVSLAHKEERPGKYKCELCSLSYCSQSHLNRHKNKVHTGMKTVMEHDKKRDKNKSKNKYKKKLERMDVLSTEGENDYEGQQIKVTVGKRKKGDDSIKKEECSNVAKRQKIAVVQEKSKMTIAHKEEDSQTESSSESTESGTNGSQNGLEEGGSERKGDDSEVSSVVYVSIQ